MPHVQYPITRHFVTIDGRWGPRQVHYRRAGQGPAVLLLHQSPQSSREMQDLMQRWAPHFTLIAPDTPGYGQSDSLGQPRVSVDDFATALLELADALGLRRFGIYGYHTGATIGLWAAARHPERVTALACNGLTQATEQERRDLLENYLPALVPAWDGSHLAWLWARLREQTIFFPWYRHTAATRMGLDVPSPERLQTGLLEFLRAGAHYPLAYRAAFQSQPETVLPGLRVPLLVTSPDGDPLQAHIGRLRDLPAGTELAPVADSASAYERALRHLLAHRGDPAPPAVATRPIAGRLWSRMLGAQGEIHVLANLEGNGEPLLGLHGAGGSALTLRQLTSALVGTRPVVLPDLPGHGESAPPTHADGPSIGDCAETTRAVLNELGLSRIVLAGHEEGALVTLELARSGARRRGRLILLDLPRPTPELGAAWRERGLPKLTPEWHGGHLLHAWHLLRDARLFFPAFERDRTHARRIEPDLDPQRLQLELTELLKAEGAWQSLRRSALAYPTEAALARLEGMALLAAGPQSVWLEAARTSAALSAGLQFVALSGNRKQWLPGLLAQLT